MVNSWDGRCNDSDDDNGNDVTALRRGRIVAAAMAVTAEGRGWFYRRFYVGCISAAC
jgi:hypothetical protein